MKIFIKRITAIIDKALNEKNRNIIVAIDGRCASGKTTLSAMLGEIYGCKIIHMDHFFLRDEQRTAERLSVPGENIDHERFLAEVLLPLRDCGEKNEIFYRPFDCSERTLVEPIRIERKRVNIIEGSYSCHPSLRDYYDLKLFLTVNAEEQLRRIVKREDKDKADIFKAKWIPLEEKYFSAFNVKNSCDHSFET